MHILVCAATETEIAPTIQAVSLIEKHSVGFLITGVGLMAATYSLTKELVSNSPSLVIQAGVAGSLGTVQTLAAVVAVKSECVGDLGVKERSGFQSLFDLQLLNKDTWPWQNGRLVNETDLLTTIGLPVVDGVTVNEISTSEETIHYYRQHLGVQIESMEGAALHYTALQEKIPFLQIRSLSNFIGERNKAAWKLKEAIANLNQTLQQILTKLEAI